MKTIGIGRMLLVTVILALGYLGLMVMVAGVTKNPEVTLTVSGVATRTLELFGSVVVGLTSVFLSLFLTCKLIRTK